MKKELKQTLIKAKDFLHYIGKGHPVRMYKAEEISQEIITHLLSASLDEREPVEVKVREVDRYRDGGTIQYEDEFGQQYFLWWGNKRIFNVYPTDEAKALKEFEELPENSVIFERKVKLVILS